ncbi:MAG: hypothetical protein WBH85_11355 [Thermoanaerobaculia bacterium]
MANKGIPARSLTVLVAVGVICVAMWSWPSMATAAGRSSSLPYLLQLRGQRVTVHYTAGALNRAALVQKRFEFMTDEFKSWGGQPSLTVVYLISRQEWEETDLAEPFGLPGNMGISQVALGSWGDDGSIDLWEGLTGRDIPPIQGTPMRGTPQEAASLWLGDLVAQVGVARGLLETSGFYGDEPWVDGLLAQLLALSTSQAHEKLQMPQIARFWLALSQQGGGPGKHPLSAQRQATTPAEKLWFDAQFYEGARLLAEAEGKDAPKKVLKPAKKGDGRISGRDLLARYPVLGDWLATSFAAD